MYLIILEVKLQAKSGCFVNKAQVVYLFTNNVKKKNYHFFYKISYGKQNKRIQCVQK